LIRILANDLQKEEVLKKGTDAKLLTWVTDIDELVHDEAEAYIDLLFFPSEERIHKLETVQPRTVLVHSVTNDLQSIHCSFIRINAWPGFIERSLVECAVKDDESRKQAAALFSRLKWEYVVLPDTAGFIAARVVAMIINEAYLALKDGVSTKAEIDIAMKTGTNYPLGPFEWGMKIGLYEVLRLLKKLAETDHRYQPAELLLLEASASTDHYH
jgi:3-hydroxybutyryl-CoA dehydrogenase